MNDRPLISLVVPACGCAKYLPRLFESLEKQTFRDFEVLFAVEESSDDSLERCRRWSGGNGGSGEKNPPTPQTSASRTFSLPRTGAGGASRNRCYREAVGEYLVPLDGDDWLEPDALELIAGAIRGHRPDVILGTARIWIDRGDGRPVPTEELIANLTAAEDGAVMSGVEFIRRLARRGAHCRNHGALVTVRRELLLERGLFQLEGTPSEDSDWTPRVILAARKLVFLARPYYDYRRREDSVSSVQDARILRATAAIALRMSSFLRTADLPGDVRRHLGNDAVSIFNWYLFNRVYARRFTRKDRLAAIRSVTATAEAAAGYRWLFGCASRAKRAGFPLIRFAALTGLLFPATLYYRYLYYPMTKYRQ